MQIVSGFDVICHQQHSLKWHLYELQLPTKKIQLRVNQGVSESKIEWWGTYTVCNNHNERQ